MVETVLVVEDDQQVRTLVTTILKKLGHRTVEGHQRLAGAGGTAAAGGSRHS